MANTWNGYREGGMDWTTTEFNNLNTDPTPTGVYGQIYLKPGINAINMSGVGSWVCILPTGLEKANRAFTVVDAFGGSDSCNIVISGNNGETFSYPNISGTYNSGKAPVPSGFYRINTDFASVTFRNYNGTPTGWYLAK